MAATMASHTTNAYKGRKGTKRSAPEPEDAPELKRSKLPWPFSGFLSPGKEKPHPDLEPEPVSMTKIERAAIKAKQSPEWQNLSGAGRIDAIHDEMREIESEEMLRCPEQTKKLDFQLDIKSDDSRWRKYHARFQTELKKRTVAEVLNRHFEEGQKLAIVPPPTQGFIFDIQNDHSEEYKEILKGELKGAKNNLITKLTMLHFGLPVGPLSLTNVLNAGFDEDDPDDAPEDLPRVQRIMFAEKPLEFLDLYHERSYGFPILRKPKPRVNLALSTDTEPIGANNFIAGDEYFLGFHPPVPIFPEGTTVSMRGGVGDPVIVYGLNGIGVQIQDEREDSEQEFLTAALRIICLPTTTVSFEFVVDQYRNQEKNKDEPEKQHVKSFPMNQSNFPHIYKQYLQARLYNQQRDWPLVVRNPPDRMSPTFTIPKRLKKPALSPPPTIKQSLSPSKSGPILPHPKVSPKRKQPPPRSPPKSPRKKTPPSQPIVEVDEDFYLPDEPPPDDLLPALPSMARPTPGPDERVVYSLDGKKSAIFKDDHRSFYEAALKVTSQKWGRKDRPEFTVTQYNNSPVRECPLGKFAYIGSEKWSEGSDNLRSYQNSVEGVMFKKKDTDRNALAFTDYHKDWRVIAHTSQPRVVEYWPQESHSDKMVDVMDYKAPSTCRRPSPAKQQPPGAGGDLSRGNRPTPPSLQQQKGQKQTSGTAPVARSGYIHGFGGKLLAENTAADFKRAALQLLGDDRGPIYFRTGRVGFVQSKDVIVTLQNFEQRFESEIVPQISSTGDWEIFVSKSQLQSDASLEPEEGDRNVVRITHLNDTAYWKIAKDTETDYGINQLQEGFSRAMRVLFPRASGRPQQNVRIGPEPVVDIGFSGMEVTEELWDRVRRDLNHQASGLTYSIGLVNVGAEKKLLNAAQLIGIRLVGSADFASAQPTDYVKMQKEIVRMGKFLKDGRNPDQFRIWKTAGDWEVGGSSALIDYKPATKSAAAIQRFLEGVPYSTDCIWFRPEFPTISIKDITGSKGKTVDWEGRTTPARCMIGFVEALQKVFNESDPMAIKDIEINDVDGQHRFIFSADMTSFQFRKDIYDWFSGNVIMVQQNKKIVYQVEQTPPWGVREPVPSPVVPNTRTQNQTPTTAGPISPKTMPNYQPPNTMPRINKERLLKRRVAPPKVTQWVDWSLESSRLDRLQRNSYHTDQSVIEPGQQPAPPIYGPSRQAPLSVGTNMPEPYFWGITPSDFARKAEECQALRNSCLERMSRCQLCDVTFPEYETEKIAEHLSDHQDALRATGKCPLCDCYWVALDKEQKKQHLWNHQTEGEQDLIRNFWQGFQCPICDVDLQSLSSEDILVHMADHPPGLLRFCDRCGMDISSCLEVERHHHKRTCLETETNEKIVHCTGCGKDRSHETEQDSQIHDRLCNGNQIFCTKCALDVSQLPIGDEIRHCNRCKPHGGPRKTFCQRCGKNLVVMDSHARARHKQECYLREPQINERERIGELERRILDARTLKAYNNAEDARLSLKKRELDEREKATRSHEAGLGIHVPRGAGLQNSPSMFKCPLLKPCGSVCNQEITITPCSEELKAHYQHDCQPCGNNCGEAGLQELLRLYPELNAGSNKLRVAAEKAKAQKVKERPGPCSIPCGGNATDATSGTVDGEEVVPRRPTAGKGKSPNKAPAPKAAKPASKAKKTPPSDPLADERDEAEEDPNLQPVSGTERLETTGFERRSHKHKTPPSPRKVSGKATAGSKRKKAVTEDNDGEAGDHPGVLFPKTPRGKRQRTMREEGFAGDESGEGNIDREVSTQTAGVRRTTRATSGTPGPSMAGPVVRKIGRPKVHRLEEADEEEAEVMRSPGKRGRPKSPKKGVE